MTPTCLSDMDGLTYPTMNGSMDNLVAGPNPTPVVPVIPTTTDPGWSQVPPSRPGWPATVHFFAVISELLVVLGRNIAPPLLKLVISPLVGPGNRVWRGSIYTPCISVFLSCISKIPNLSQTAPSHYLIAVWLLGWVRQCNVAAAVVNVIATQYYAMVTLSLPPKMCKSFLSFAPISPKSLAKATRSWPIIRF